MVADFRMRIRQEIRSLEGSWLALLMRCSRAEGVVTALAGKMDKWHCAHTPAPSQALPIGIFAFRSTRKMLLPLRALMLQLSCGMLIWMDSDIEIN